MKKIPKNKKLKIQTLDEFNNWYHQKHVELFKDFEKRRERLYPLSNKDMCIMDEQMMWKEATPEEAEQAKIAYEKWKNKNQ